MGEFDHWYTKEDYEALERNKNAEIRALKKKITAIRDLIDGVEPVREVNLSSLAAQQMEAIRPMRGGGNPYVSGDSFLRNILGF